MRETSEMSVIDVKEAIQFFKSYGFKVDENLVKEWVKDTNKLESPSSKIRPVVEDDLHRYSDWYFVRGTAYEEGIDDKSKIARLLEEVSLQKRQIVDLEKEKRHLEELVGLNDF